MMTLSEFTTNWWNPDRRVVVNDYKHIDEVLDNYEDGKSIEDIGSDFSFEPAFSQWKSRVYLHPKWASAEVEAFLIHKDALIVFVSPEGGDQ